jgi:hypothetical protein
MFADHSLVIGHIDTEDLVVSDIGLDPTDVGGE